MVRVPNLFKRGMQDHMYLHKFSYDQFMQHYQIEAFLLDFFNDAHVQGALRVLGTQDRWGKLGKVTSVSTEETLHTVTSLSFFDRLKSQGTYLFFDAFRNREAIGRNCQMSGRIL